MELDTFLQQHTKFVPKDNVDKRSKVFDYFDMMDFADAWLKKNGEMENEDLKNMLIEVKEQVQATGRVPKKLLDRIVLTLEENALKGL